MILLGEVHINLLLLFNNELKNINIWNSIDSEYLAEKYLSPFNSWNFIKINSNFWKYCINKLF